MLRSMCIGKEVTGQREAGKNLQPPFTLIIEVGSVFTALTNMHAARLIGSLNLQEQATGSESAVIIVTHAKLPGVGI
jgi:hypothetical protein